MREQGYTPLEAEPCIYTRLVDGHLLIVAVYVDDTLFACKDDAARDAAVSAFDARFPLRRMGEPRKVLGMEIVRDRAAGTLSLRHSAYLDGVVAQYGQADAYPALTPLPVGLELSYDEAMADEVEEGMARVPVRGAIGSLMHSAVTTRPDLTHAVMFLARFTSRPTPRLWKAVQHVLRYVRGTTSHGITFRRTSEPLRLQCYSDADYAGCGDTRKSTSGQIILLAGGPVFWRSKRQSVTTTSTADAEMAAVNELAVATRALVQIAGPIGVDVRGPQRLRCDNQAAVKSLHNPEHRGLTKFLDVRNHVVRELMRIGAVIVGWISTRDQLADPLTKSLPADHMRSLWTRAGCGPT